MTIRKLITPLVFLLSTPVVYAQNNNLVVELESLSGQGSFSPFNVEFDSAASGGQYIAWPNNGNQLLSSPSDGATGQAEIPFTLSQTANVQFQIRVNMPNANDDSFYYKLDSGSWNTQNNTATSGWGMLTPATFNNLPAGDHTLRILRREDGAGLDQVTLTASAGEITGSGSGGDSMIVVRALGTTGSESITLRVGGTDVQSWTLTTAMMDYTATTDLEGDVTVAFTNDNNGDADVQIDYVQVNGQVRQAEDQSENTGAWGNNQCGGGSNSEWLHCNGYINFGSTSDPDDSGSAGCGSALGLSNGRHNINVGGLNREYIIDIPNNYDMNNPYRLVFAWHWRGGSADNVANDSYYNLKGLSNGTAIFVAPNRAEGTDGWTNTNGRDMDFLRAMLDEFNNAFFIDEERIFSAGWSYGGMMSFAVGREMAATFRAIAPASGALWTPYNDSGLPMAAWISHGTNDSVVGFGSGEEAKDLYVSANNCSSTTVPTDPWPCVEYQNCDAGHPVVWCPFSGGHSTPSFYSSAVWDFFSRF